MAEIFINKTKIKKCELYKENDNYYLHVKYEVEKLDGIYEIDIPKVDIGLDNANCDIDMEDSGWNWGLGHTRTFKLRGIHGHEFIVCDVGDYEFITEKCIKKKVKKMTISEIEKKLGYPVEIIAEK